MLKSSIGYEGKVTIKVKDKPGPPRHNNGTIYFFNVLSNILTGILVLDDLAKLNKQLPAYINIIHNDSGNVSTEEIFNNGIFTDQLRDNSILLHDLPISSRQVEPQGIYETSETTHRIKYSCLLTHDMINTSVKTSNRSGYIIMLDGSNERILAYANIDLYKLNPLYENTSGQAAIDWEMSFGNVISEA